MARGWESKAVEAQVEERQAAKVERRPDENDPSEVERKQKRDSIERSRRRVLHDLETTSSEVHRTALRNALDFLDGELERLNR